MNSSGQLLLAGKTDGKRFILVSDQTTELTPAWSIQTECLHSTMFDVVWGDDDHIFEVCDLCDVIRVYGTILCKKRECNAVAICNGPKGFEFVLDKQKWLSRFEWLKDKKTTQFHGSKKTSIT